MAHWLLPENISDVLPEEARAVEALRRTLLDLYRGYGYELVIPPLLEHLESLLTGSGRDLGLRTFKLVDQLGGRTLGLRADTTPQVARIDSHILNRAGVARLCYAGSTLHATPMHPLASREPLQVGAEIYGDPSAAADLEVLQLAVRSARASGSARVQVDLGHTGVVRAVLGASLPSGEAADEVLAALSGKNAAALREAARTLPAATQAALQAMLELHGDSAVLARARRVLPGSVALDSALADLALLARAAGADEASIDLADLHGFRYHTGATFAVYVGGLSWPLLRGGRYDDIGRAFGRARPATGFSLLDLREAARLAAPATAHAIRAPRLPDARLEAQVDALRARGEVVIRAEAGVPAGISWIIDRELALIDGEWRVRVVPGGHHGADASGQG